MKSSKHQQAILIFSVAIPLLILGGLFGGTFYAKSTVGKLYSEKKTKFDSYQTAKLEVGKLEAELAVGDRDAKIEYWEGKLEQDFIPTLSETISKFLARYDEDTLRQTALSPSKDSSSIARGAGNPHTVVNLQFQGGFKPMQLLLTELESEMPQLVLERLSITPKVDVEDDAKGKLDFNVVYLAWNKTSE